MRRLALLLLLALPLLVFAAPVPKETEKDKMKRLFGEVADARKGYDFTLDGDKLVVTMAGNASENATSDEKLPRVEQQVKGDFEAMATLTFAPPKGKYADAGERPFISAGWCVQAADGESLMVGPYFGLLAGNKNADGWGCGSFVRDHTPKEKSKRSYTLGQRLKFCSFADYHLRLRREGDTFVFSESENGKDWVEGMSRKFDFPPTVSVGLAGLNGSDQEGTATFSDFTVTPLPKK